MKMDELEPRPSVPHVLSNFFNVRICVNGILLIKSALDLPETAFATLVLSLQTVKCLNCIKNIDSKTYYWHCCRGTFVLRKSQI